MRERYLTVPLNEKGKEEYDFGYDHKDNLKNIVLSEDEFNHLAQSGVFNHINDMCGLMIDDYESEIISSSDLKKCLDELNDYEGDFLRASKLAIQYNTFLALDF